ncbi:MAG: putative aliphatic sulfonates transport permease protein SsuC [Actinobacteria bacterium]|nr:putative aliphatic sulfonates transport permease protein SsuC [Actinomycetota bacterium]
MNGFLRRIIFYALLIAIWEMVFRLHIWEEFLFPAPLSVLQTLVNGFMDRTFLIGIAISMRRITIGYGISVIAGILLGLLIGRVKLLDETVGSLVLGLQTLPSITWLPLALLWFGLNEKAIIFVVIMGAVFSITIGTYSGVKGVPPLYLKAGRNMGAQGYQLFLQVIIPAALPSIVVGLKQGWSWAWRSLMAGELLFVSLGLGFLLMMGRELNDMSQVIAVMIIIIIIGLVVDKLIFAKLERNLYERWGLDLA